jgi:hypothetical protein
MTLSNDRVIFVSSSLSHIFELVKSVFVFLLSAIAAASSTLVVVFVEVLYISEWIEVLNSFFQFQQYAYRAALIY